MSRSNYVCTVCLQHFTRKYSAKRRDSNIHGGRSEIVPFIEFMVGRSSGRYLASHPSWHIASRDKSKRIAALTFVLLLTRQVRSDLQLQPYPAALPNSQSATIQQKLDELRILAAKFSFPQDARKILEWANIRLQVTTRR